MTEPNREPSQGALAESTALVLGRQVLGREPTADEAAALVLIFNASAQALREGYIVRLAEHVRTERENERVEEFFEDIKPD